MQENAALLLGCVEQIQQSLGLDDGQCQVTDTPMGFPLGKELCVSVSPGPIEYESNDHSRLERHGVIATVSVKTSQTRRTDQGIKTIAADAGVSEIARKVISAVESDYDMLARVNEKIDADRHVFAERLRAKTCSAPRPQPSSWWGGQDAKTIVGFSFEILFTGALTGEMYA